MISKKVLINFIAVFFLLIFTFSVCASEIDDTNIESEDFEEQEVYDETGTQTKSSSAFRPWVLGADFNENAWYKFNYNTGRFLSSSYYKSAVAVAAGNHRWRISKGGNAYKYYGSGKEARKYKYHWDGKALDISSDKDFTCLVSGNGNLWCYSNSLGRFVKSSYLSNYFDGKARKIHVTTNYLGASGNKINARYIIDNVGKAYRIIQDPEQYEIVELIANDRVWDIGGQHRFFMDGNQPYVIMNGGGLGIVANDRIDVFYPWYELNNYKPYLPIRIDSSISDDYYDYYHLWITTFREDNEGRTTFHYHGKYGEIPFRWEAEDKNLSDIACE